MSTTSTPSREPATRDPMARGALYIVATPIGNLQDIGLRALDVLGRVDAVLAEDTRHTRNLMRHYGLRTPLVSLHEHNEAAMIPKVSARLARGQSLALVSDAGTPLVSDPGYALIRALAGQGRAVLAVPGASAVLGALSVSGLPTDRFAFEGFPPARAARRLAWFGEIADEGRTLVFFESPRRLAGALSDLAAALGADREACVARELTKAHEQVVRGTLGALVDAVAAGEIPARGELVIVVAGHRVGETDADPREATARELLASLLEGVPVRSAVDAVSSATGVRRNRVYQLALALREPDRG